MENRNRSTQMCVCVQTDLKFTESNTDRNPHASVIWETCTHKHTQGYLKEILLFVFIHFHVLIISLFLSIIPPFLPPSSLPFLSLLLNNPLNSHTFILFLSLLISSSFPSPCLSCSSLYLFLPCSLFICPFFPLLFVFLCLSPPPSHPSHRSMLSSTVDKSEKTSGVLSSSSNNDENNSSPGSGNTGMLCTFITDCELCHKSET